MRCSIAVLLAALPAVLFAQSGAPKTFQTEYDGWFKLHPLPKQDASPDEREAFEQQVAGAAAEWVKHWPDDPRALLQRFKTLARLKSTSNQQLEEAGDALLRVSREHPLKGFRFVPIQTQVAMVWDARNIRLEQCLALAREAVIEDERAQIDNPSTAKQFMTVVVQGLFETLNIEYDVAQKLKKPEIARSAVSQMKQWLDDHPNDGAFFEHKYLELSAAEANTEGRKLDALMYYLRDVRATPHDSEAENRAAALWKELGGTDSGYKEWTASEVEPKRAVPITRKEAPHWLPMGKPLSSFQGTDVNGRLWTVDDLKGRTTLVNVWATGCSPCQKELPMVQKIFDQVRGRSDVQVLSVSTDENQALVGKFLRTVQYTFPVILMAEDNVDKMVGISGIPRTWIVDSQGIVRFEMTGYDAADWPDRVRQQLAVVK